MDRLATANDDACTDFLNSPRAMANRFLSKTI
jgi:hypothetical protein